MDKYTPDALYSATEGPEGMPVAITLTEFLSAEGETGVTVLDWIDPEDGTQHFRLECPGPISDYVVADED